MPWPLHPDGPFWPWFVGVAACLFLAGVVNGKWRVAAIVLFGEVMAVVIFKHAAYSSLVLCTSWLFFAYLMAYNGGKVPAFFYTLAGLTSGALFVFGIGLVPWGPAPVLIDIFSALALLSVGGGIVGFLDNSCHNRARLLDRVSLASMGLAPRQASHPEIAGRGEKMKAGR